MPADVRDLHPRRLGLKIRHAGDVGNLGTVSFGAISDIGTGLPLRRDQRQHRCDGRADRELDEGWSADAVRLHVATDAISSRSVVRFLTLCTAPKCQL